MGLPDQNGESTDIPSEVAELLTSPGVWRVGVRTFGDPKWYRNQATYTDYFEALVWGMVTLERWTLAEDVRVVPMLPDELAGQAPKPAANPSEIPHGAASRKLFHWTLNILAVAHRMRTVDSTLTAEPAHPMSRVQSSSCSHSKTESEPTMPRNSHLARRRIRAASGALLTTVVLAGALTACSSSSGGGTNAPATLWALTGDQDGVVAPAVKDWNSANPKQTINAQFFANDAYKTKIKTAVGAGSAPTIIYSWAGGTLQNYVDNNKVADITSDTDSIKGKFNQSVWDLGVVNGKTYAVPMDPSYPVVLYSNKEVLAHAGVEAPKTWDELLAAIPKLKSAGVLPFALAGGSKWPELMWEEYLVDRVAGPAAFQAVEAGKKDAWSDAGIVKANEMIQQLVDAGAFGDSFNSVVADSNADVALVYTGKAAMLLQGAWAYGAFKAGAADFTSSNLGYTPFPAVDGGKGDPANIVGNVSGYFSVSANASKSQKKDAIDFLTKEVFNETYTKRVLANGQVPPIKGVAKLIDGGADTFLGNTASLIDAAPHFQMSWDQALPSAQATALLTNLDKLFSKQITPKQFSDAMNATIGQ